MRWHNHTAKSLCVCLVLALSATARDAEHASTSEVKHAAQSVKPHVPALLINLYVVEGHTDTMGSDAVNHELSLKRAITVRDYLIRSGIPASATDVAGLGSSAPLADNTTASGRASKRRVEIVVSGPPLYGEPVQNRVGAGSACCAS